MLGKLKKAVSDTNPLRLTYHRARGWLAAAVAGFPAKKLRVISVTGTDGKTTTVAMIAHILHHCGKRVGAVSTAFFEINGKREVNPTQKTSIEAKKMQAFLQKLVNEGCEFAVIESSSHGLMQGRLAGIRPEVAAVTNTAMEHLDYHGTMEEYIRAKAMLFRQMRGQGTKVLNEDDQTFAVYKTIPSAQIISYSPGKQLIHISTTPISCEATFTMDGKTYRLQLPVPGAFNLENALAAIGCCKAVGIDPAQSVAALKSFKPAPGRMQKIDAGQPFSVYIDFTVTPQAFEKTLTTLRSTIEPGKRILVMTGSCGDRMREKRPIIGRILSELADFAVITDEEPYTEDPQAIIDEIWAGIDQAKIEAHQILDRLEAIRFTLSQAQPGDAVIFCGLGSYPSRMMASGQIPWDEQQIVRDELKKQAF